MRHPSPTKGHLIGFTLLATLAVRGYPCGPFFTEMAFVTPLYPDNLAAFVQGSPFIVERDYAIRSLALSYRMLNGPALTPAEQKDLSVTYTLDPPSEPSNEGFTAWQHARQELLSDSASPENPPGRGQDVPGSPWQTYENCQNDAYATAAKTLLQRRRQYPQAHAAILEWVRGQDTVFSNCDAVAELPGTPPPGSPLWLQQDRAYQIAAAHFYRREWKDAASTFTAIAADRSSPWHDLAPYLLGRTLIRQATLVPEQTFDAAILAQAEQQMQRVAAAHSPYSASAEKMLNLITLRLNPAAAIARMGDRISAPDPNLGQDIIDLRYVFGNDAVREAFVRPSPSDLIDWIENMSSGSKPGYADERWRQTHHPAWLVLALQTDQPAPADILAAAAEIPQDSPAWATCTFLRLKNAPPTAAVSAEILRDRDFLIASHALTSTINQFTALALERASTASAYSALAPMEPAGITDDYDLEFTPLKSAPKASTGFPPSPSPTMAGLPINVGLDLKRFAPETAKVLNRNLPLSALVPLILDSKWPKQLRFEAAIAAFSRAVLLNQPEDARKLIPILLEGEPGWGPWLKPYVTASTPDDLRVTGLLALLRFPSVRPYVNAGPTRGGGFVGYSIYRDNWWCAALDKDYDEQHNPQPSGMLPPFITPALTSAAQREYSQLAQLGDAPAYFGNQTLAWVKAHPSDSRNPELLGFTFRAMRNGCSLEDTYALRRRVYDILQSRYPTSTWAKRWPGFTDPDGAN